MGTRTGCHLTKRQRLWQARLLAGGMRVPAAVIREVDEQIDRHIKRWLSRLLIVGRSPSGQPAASKVGKIQTPSLMAKPKGRRTPK
jgi:hypothetical protein